MTERRIDPEDAMVGERPRVPDPLQPFYKMGFGYARPAEAMRLCNNNFEDALQMLIAEGGGGE